MGKNFTTAFAVCLLVSALPLACGDDEEPGDGGKGGKGGSSTGGSSGASGSSGRGGTSGSSGSSGSSGTGGMTGGTSGTGGRTGGTGGMTGGTAGTDGGMGGDDGGMGGEGGAPGPMTFTCAELCVHVASVTTCSDQQMCDVEICQMPLDPSCEGVVQALHDCLGNGPDSNFSCMTNKPSYDYGTGTCDAEFDAVFLCP